MIVGQQYDYWASTHISPTSKEGCVCNEATAERQPLAAMFFFFSFIVVATMVTFFEQLAAAVLRS